VYINKTTFLEVYMSKVSSTINKSINIFDNIKDILYIDNDGGAVFMNTFRAINILDSIIPISRFNKGEANKIFAEVKNNGLRIVVKNNVPECVLISPQDYQKMIEEYEDLKLYAMAEKRLAENTASVSQDDLLKSLGLAQSDLDGVEVEVE